MSYIEIVVPGEFADTTGLLEVPDLTSGLLLDFDADTITGISDGDPISSWTSKGANTLTLSATAGETTKPLFREAEINGHAALEFGGTNSIQGGSGVTIFASSTPSTQVVIYRPTGEDTSEKRLTAGVGSGGYRVVGDKEGRPYLRTSATGSGSTSNWYLDGDVDTWRVVVGRWSPTTASLFTSFSNAVDTETVDEAPLTGITIGTTGGGNSGFTGLITRAMYFERALTDVEVRALIDVLVVRYAIDLEEEGS